MYITLSSTCIPKFNIRHAPLCFIITFCSRWGMEWDKSYSMESLLFLQACLSRLFKSFMVFGGGSLQKTSSIMLQRFCTGFISGEFGGQLVSSVKFGRLFLHHAWVTLAACAGAPSWTNVMYRLKLNSFRLSNASFTFYGEGEASILSLICCWCSSRQSKFVLGYKWSPVRPWPVIPPQMIHFENFCLVCRRPLNNIIFGIRKPK